MSKASDKIADDPLSRVVCRNRRARHEYELFDQLECGIQLRGSEVKSLRAGHVQINEAFARVDDRGELWLEGMHIAPYQFAAGVGAHEPDRKRKLLLHRREIEKFAGKATQKGFTLVPLRLYFKQGRAKVELAVARGKQLHDKRETLKRRTQEREAQRAVRGE